MPIVTSSRSLVEAAMQAVRTYSVSDAVSRLKAPNVLFVDIRDVRELEHGTIAGAYHAPRGMLEFWVDPESPYYKPVLGDNDKEYILFCGAGWRSALATKALQDMGMTNVAHVDGGFAAWLQQGAPIESLEAMKARSSAQRRANKA